MPVIRNKISSVTSGGPRQFTEIRDKLYASVSDDEAMKEAQEELRERGFVTEDLDATNVIIARPEKDVEDVLRKFQQFELDGETAKGAIEDVKNGADEVMEATSSIVSATDQMVNAVSQFDSILDADFLYTYADYGPENLRLSPTSAPTVPPEEYNETKSTLSDLNENLQMEKVWEITKGENAISAVFDTGFARGLIDKKRIVGRFSGDDVDTVYAPSEGHGTMTLGAMAANNDKEGVPYNGIAPESGVILVRITDSEGQIRQDYISEAWDWLVKQEFRRPVVANHSYGVPLCSGRPRGKYCNTPSAKQIELASSKADVTSVYAAGNEAMRCGHRPSGITNAITGVNSLASVVTVGALRMDGIEAQRYSSHGRGDCAPVSDPKPNVCFPLPSKVYYGVDGGWEIKDMSIGIGGSAGGTSHASPSTAGAIALIQSLAMTDSKQALQSEEVKTIIERTADRPRRTQVSVIGGLTSKEGYDARFGHGKVNVLEAVREVKE